MPARQSRPGLRSTIADIPSISYYVRFFNGDAGRFIKSMEVDPFFQALVERIEAPQEGDGTFLAAVWEAIENVLLLRSSIKTHPLTPRLLPLALSLLNSASLPPPVTGKILDVLLLLARKKVSSCLQ